MPFIVKYRKSFLSEPLTDREKRSILPAAARDGSVAIGPCGDRRFVRQLERRTGRSLTPGRPGRPKGSRVEAQGDRITSPELLNRYYVPGTVPC